MMKSVKYFRAEDSVDHPDRFHLGSPITQGGEELDPRVFTECRRYEGPEPLWLPVSSGTQQLDFMFAAFDMPVVTPRIGALIRRLARGGVQTVLVAIQGNRSPVEILNVMTLREAINEKESEITWWKPEDGLPHKVGEYAAIGKLVLNREKIGSAPILRLRGWELPLIVSDLIKDSLEAMNVTGVTFTELSVR